MRIQELVEDGKIGGVLNPDTPSKSAKLLVDFLNTGNLRLNAPVLEGKSRKAQTLKLLQHLHDRTHAN